MRDSETFSVFSKSFLKKIQCKKRHVVQDSSRGRHTYMNAILPYFRFGGQRATIQQTMYIIA